MVFSLEVQLLFIIAGLIFILMALTSTVLKRLPLTTSIIYMLIGFLLGAFGSGLVKLDPLENAAILEHLTEVAVIISLFTAGLKLRIPLKEGRWKIALRLAFISMTITVGLITLSGLFLLNLPIGAAVLLGGILAPTDPVLASEVQVEKPGDRDRLRFGLTGEAGLNDGTAFPFVMLGLGLLGLHNLGDFGWQWLAIDVIWSIIVGLGTGLILGTLVGRLVVYLRLQHKEAVGLDDFLTMGLIALSYGVALLFHSYGFLAVFAAGLALRRVEMAHTGENSTPTQETEVINGVELGQAAATDPDKAGAYMTQAVLGINEQLERICEVIVVVILGVLLTKIEFPFEALWFIPLLFLIIRPLSVGFGLVGSKVLPVQRRLMSWFGIRGVGSIYYLMYAIEHGLEPDLAQRLTAITLSVIAVSIVVHGISVTPLMHFYSNRRSFRRKEAN